MGRIIRPNGEATLVTDDVAYSEQMIAHFSSWKSAFGPPHYITEWPEFGDSFFHSLWTKAAANDPLSSFYTIKSEEEKDRGRGI